LLSEPGLKRTEQDGKKRKTGLQEKFSQGSVKRENMRFSLKKLQRGTQKRKGPSKSKRERKENQQKLGRGARKRKEGRAYQSAEEKLSTKQGLGELEKHAFNLGGDSESWWFKLLIQRGGGVHSNNLRESQCLKDQGHQVNAKLGL